jgi:DNA-directed RNA polymerase specialized sigma subunit
MTDYKATFEQWNDVKRLANATEYASTDHCILELLSRVKALEIAQKQTPNLDEVKSSLVERVQKAIDNHYQSDNNLEAVAAICEIVEWLYEEMWPEVAEELKQQIK